MKPLNHYQPINSLFQNYNSEIKNGGKNLNLLSQVEYSENCGGFSREIKSQVFPIHFSLGLIVLYCSFIVKDRHPRINRHFRNLMKDSNKMCCFNCYKDTGKDVQKQTEEDECVKVTRPAS